MFWHLDWCWGWSSAFNMSLNEAIRLGEVGRWCGVVDVLTPEKLLKFNKSEGRVIFGVHLAVGAYCAFNSCIFDTGTGPIWRLPWIGRGIYWTVHSWGGTLCLCDGSNWLWSPAMGHWGYLEAAWARLVEKACAWCICGTSWCSWLYLHLCWASELPLWLGTAFFLSLVFTMEVSKGMGKEFGGMQTQSPLKRKLASMDSSSWVPQKWQTIPGMFLRWSGHPLRVRQYRILYTRSCSAAALMVSSLSVDSWMD